MTVHRPLPVLSVALPLIRLSALHFNSSKCNENLKTLSWETRLQVTEAYAQSPLWLFPLSTLILEGYIQ